MTEVFCPQLIKKMAKERGVTQGCLAEKCGVDRLTMNRWLQGARAPRADFLPLIAKALGCEVADFFDAVPDDGIEGT